MSELTALFCKRIDIPENEKITFGSLDRILERIVQTIPFENLSIIEQRTKEITKENLIDKILLRNEGGLCYELNSLFYFFLLDNGFDATLVRGTVYDSETEKWSIAGTHVVILVTHEGQPYLLDTGFGANLPLKPVPLDGTIITSAIGEFRTKRIDSDYGDYQLEMKIKRKQSDWTLGYAFGTTNLIKEAAELSEIQRILIEEQESTFNKHPLLVRHTERGHLTLTDKTITQWHDGQMTKEEIDKRQFKDLAERYFGLRTVW